MKSTTINHTSLLSCLKKKKKKKKNLPKTFQEFRISEHKQSISFSLHVLW